MYLINLLYLCSVNNKHSIHFKIQKIMAAIFTNVNGNGFTLYKEGTVREVHTESVALRKRAQRKSFDVSFPEVNDDGINIYYFFRGDLIVVSHICHNDRELAEFKANNAIH